MFETIVALALAIPFFGTGIIALLRDWANAEEEKSFNQHTALNKMADLDARVAWVNAR